ncbi:OPT/YSL family transporter [Sinanaerobacter chloroacetimidivorans]|uniref:OPT/YSL family transporter n=1 Tax=Sinanaerobacter chloroacetimidivorans TaxID=2818044 RepID=A0A8J8B0D9_9FIRM|nr:OPT/YSL family transporter [Sinanaerobacter chloroacetimidivorans]MBR0596707.1 OPT/YSL family transporter [Sinanaerobacter chloroacetimidivorans]
MSDIQKSVKYAISFKEQFTVRGMIIGAIGAVILTMSSMYVALKLGALPWPIIFVALVSMFCLKVLGNTNINEINVTHTAMSAGAMTAGGLAFTIPGIFILDKEADLSMAALFATVFGGVILGLIFTALIRKYFVVTKELPYPMGQAAAETLIVGDEGGQKSLTLFISLGIAAIFTVLRDWFAAIPATIMNSSLVGKGVYGGIWLSPMLIAVGYIIGPLFIGVWFLGAIIGDFGIVIGGTAWGWWDAGTASAIKSSLGIGLMVGTGVGIIVKGILPKAKEIFGPMFSKGAMSGSFINLRWAPIVMVILAFVFTIVCDMGIIASIITLLGVWLATSMSAQIVGQTGINPMEVFGIIVLLAAKAVSGLGHTEAFLVAAVVAIACGLSGDVMNDFKAGHLLKSDPKAQWIGECIGGIIGAFVSVGVFYVILTAYGPEAFGNPEMFIAPQAGAVAAMVGGIPHMTSFLIGLVAGCVLYCVNFPVMTLGLGVYLPFYLSATAFIGGALKFVVEKAAPDWDKKGTGLIIASGLLGGEAVIGVIIALIQAIQGMSAL